MLRGLTLVSRRKLARLSPIQLALVSLTMAFPFAATQAPGRADLPTARWREGPIRYIITAEEDREFKQLATDEARHRFIERFWFRRDPDPSTLLNEYRIEFWHRVAASNRLFD